MNFELPAQTIEDAYDACDPEEPLLPGDQRYVDLTEVRGSDNFPQIVSQRIWRADRNHRYHKQLVTGHRGCGKSTELLCLQAALKEKGFFTVYFSVEDILDLGEITYQDILLSIAKLVEEQLRVNGMVISEELLQDITQWFEEKIISKEYKKDLELNVKGEASIGTAIPLFGKLMAGLTSQIKSGSSDRIEIRQKLERELSIFIVRLNHLLATARQHVVEKGYKDFVVLVDGLEKMHLRKKENQEIYSHIELFVHHAERLKAPDCHIVYTIPISLAFDANLGDAFPDATFIIPMVKIRDDDGVMKLRGLLEKRLKVSSLFSDPENLPKRLIAMSGGAVRDLMRLVRMSCEGGGEQITAEKVDRAQKILIREFDRLIREDDIVPLKEVYRTERVTADQRYARLLYLRLVHEYENDQRWADLHPAVKEIKWVMEKLEKQN